MGEGKRRESVEVRKRMTCGDTDLIQCKSTCVSRNNLQINNWRNLTPELAMKIYNANEKSVTDQYTFGDLLYSSSQIILQ